MSLLAASTFAQEVFAVFACVLGLAIFLIGAIAFTPWSVLAIIISAIGTIMIFLSVSYIAINF